MCYIHATEEECAICRNDLDIEQDSQARDTMACTICLLHGSEAECSICRDYLDKGHESESVDAEDEYTWIVTGEGVTFSPTLKNVYRFGNYDSSVSYDDDWTKEFPGEEFEMKLTSNDIQPTKFSIKTSGTYNRMSGF